MARNAALTVKRVHQKLGGKSPNILLPSADLILPTSSTPTTRAKIEDIQGPYALQVHLQAVDIRAKTIQVKFNP